MKHQRILLILGGIYHDFEGFSATLTPVLRKAGHKVEATCDLDLLLDLPSAGIDVVVSYTSLSRRREAEEDPQRPETLSAAQVEALTKWVRDGGGLLPVHSATVSGRPNQAMRDLMGCVFATHPPQFAFTVYPTMPKHPITEGVDAFTVVDEFYVQDFAPGQQVHMVALDRGVAHPMVWSRNEGEGRVAGIAPGHDAKVWNLEPFQRLLLQSVAWVGE